MIFNSVCEEMRSDALKLPKGENVKVYMRHSIRYDNPPDGDYSNLLLTPEGIKIANEIGRNLDLEIGYMYSSPVMRCIQTVTEIARGAGIENAKPEIAEEFAALKGLRHAQEDLHIGWYVFYYGLQRHETDKTGGVTIEEVVRPIIDKVFSVKTSDDKLDIICSHDSHVVTLASALFDYKTGINGENWCRYTEGLFFTGVREDFTAYWRGEERHFRNWLM